MQKSGQTIVDVLVGLAATVEWLAASADPVSCKSIPEERASPVRQLEMLGLVTRSGGGTFRLQKERLKKVVNHAIANCRDDRRLFYADAYRAFIAMPAGSSDY
jgi:hypothetical protein